MLFFMLKFNHIISLLAVVGFVSSVFISCKDNEYSSKAAIVDSLNLQAYDYKFINADSMILLANNAQGIAKDIGYDDGLAEAMCIRADGYYMKANFNKAMTLYDSSYNATGNELLRLSADVGRMEICQRTASNKIFYDYRNSALLKMNRLSVESSDMDSVQQSRFIAAKMRFHLSSFNYYSYLRQYDSAKIEEDSIETLIKYVEKEKQLFAFSLYNVDAEKLKYNYNSSNSSLVIALAISHSSNFRFIESAALSAFSNSLINSDNVGRTSVVKDVLGLDYGIDEDSLTRYAFDRAFELGETYGNPLIVSSALLSKCNYEISKSRYVEALALADRCLDLINEHHSMCNSDSECETAELDSTKLYDKLQCCNDVSDSISTEMRWIENSDVASVPEWMADVRERLSIIYSGLGKKWESDFNRNVYLDILDVTRQDMRMEQRLETLKEENKKNNALLFFTALFSIIIFATVIWFGKRFRRKSKIQLEQLDRVTELFKDLVSMSPLGSKSYNDDYVEKMREYIKNRRNYILGLEDKDSNKHLNAYERELIKVIEVFAEWIERIGERYVSFAETSEKLVEQKKIHELHIEEKKKSNIEKCTCVSIVNGIMPFLDRALREANKLKECPDDPNREERLSYIKELTERINIYNDVLTHWIKVRKGEVNLNIENFSLAQIFEILGKNKFSFENKGLELKISDTDAIVKADRALTLFMINTLLDNARKYTQEGGSVILEAKKENNYVEISVTDNGCGLSAEDINKITGEKVYDSRLIGAKDLNENLMKNKGYGFGLINCRGVIEKYKKTSPFFAECMFSVESKLGKGSRFFFRIPYGKLKNIFCILPLLILTLSIYGCKSGEKENTESESSVIWKPDDKLLKTASDYANKVYYANVDGHHAEAIQYADTARMYLNKYYLKKVKNGTDLMTLNGDNLMPEIDLWNKGFNTDYHVILDIRNETAIAALAINDWKLYRYNNEVYTQLYKLITQDKQIEEYCNYIQKSNTNKQTTIIFTVIILLLGLILYYLLYYRHVTISMINMRQLMAFNRQMFSFSEKESDIDIIKKGVNDIRRIDGVAIAVNSNDGKTTDFSFSTGCPDRELLKGIMRSTIINENDSSFNRGLIRTYALTVDIDGEKDTIGSVAIIFHNSSMTKEEQLALKLMFQFIAINMYYSNTLVEKCKVDIELLEDERRKIENDENNIHIQNMVLDNCLSTIKHETMFYPNRIRQIVNDLLTKGNDDKYLSGINNMYELINYYKDIFTILSENASKQLERKYFKRSIINVDSLRDYTILSLKKQNRKRQIGIELNTWEGNKNINVTGDKLQLQFLIENIISIFLENEQEGSITLDFEKSGEFGKFAFTDHRQSSETKDTASMFFVENLKYNAKTDKLDGTQYLICKQIIRQHDDRCGKRGCRIYTEKTPDNAFRIVFTLPFCI